MASSGNIDSGKFNGRTYRISWSQSQNIAGNYSTITCKHYLINPSGYDLYIYGRDNSCTVGGDTKSFTSPAISTGGNSTIHLGTTTHKVNHNADGSKSVSISGTFNIQATLAGVWHSSVSASGTVTLNSIPRGATLSAADNFYDDANPTITFSNPAGSLVSSLQACISFDGSNDDIAYRDVSKSGGTYTFNLTEAERNVLRNKIPNSETLSVIFYLRTVLSGQTFYSTLKRTMRINPQFPTADVMLAISDALTPLLTGTDNGGIIKGFTNVLWSINNAKAYKGATVKGWEITNGSFKSTASTGTITGCTDANFSVKITDSRGFYSLYTSNGELIDYFMPTIKGDLTNPTTAGEMLYRVSGKWFNSKFGTGANAVANSFKCYYRYYENDGSFAEDGSDWIEVPASDITVSGNTYTVSSKITGLNYRSRYSFQARIQDKVVNLMTSNLKTVSSIPVYDWSYKDFEFNVPVTFNQGYVNENKILANGASYMNDTQTWNLSEPISKQANGIVLVFSGYDATNKVALNSSINTFFVSKKDVELFPDTGHTFILGINAGFSGMAAKYLYFTDTSVYGHEGNTSSGTNSGITFNNSKYVLRYVIGV